MVAVTPSSGYLLLIDASDGSLIDDYYFSTPGSPLNISSVTVVGNYIYFGANDGYFYKFDPADLSAPVWSLQTGNNTTPPSYKDGVLYVTNTNYEMYAINENGTYAWPSQVAIPGKSPDFGGPVVFSEGGTLPEGGSAPAGLIGSTFNAGRVFASELSGGDRIWTYGFAGNLFSPPILLQRGTEVEAYLISGDGDLYAMEKNFAPEIQYADIQESPADDQPMVPGALDIAFLTMYVYDKNGLDDIDPDTAYINLSPLYGNPQLSLKDLGTTSYGGQTVGIFKNDPPSSYKITVPRGVPSGPMDLTVSISDLGEVTTYASATILIANTPPSIVSIEFDPDTIFPDDSDSTDITVVVEDDNIVTGQSGEIQLVSLDVEPIQGGGGTPQWIDLSCGNGYTDSGRQRVECTYSGVTAAITTAPGSVNLEVRALDSEFYEATDTQALNISSVDYFVLSADPDYIGTGASSTVTITPYKNSAPVAGYYNAATMSITVLGGTASTISYSGDRVTDNGDGTATLGVDAFSFGTATFRISNTTAEAGVKFSVTGVSGATGISNAVEWYPSGLSYFEVYWNPASLIQGNPATVSVTARDFFGNLYKGFDNPNGMLLKHKSGASEPTDLSYTHTTAGVVFDNGDGTAIFASGAAYFINGVAQFKVTNLNSDDNVIFTVEEYGTLPAKSGDSNPITWTLGPLAAFNIVADPLNLVAGASTTVTITALNSQGEVKEDFSESISLAISQGTIGTLAWSGAGIGSPGAAVSSLDGARFASGVATAALTDTTAEGPVIISAARGTVKSYSAAPDSPTWTPGPLAKLTIRTQPGGAGTILGSVTLPIGDLISCWAAGYDQYDNYIADQNSDWSTTGTLDRVTASGVDSFEFTPETPLTQGYISATSGAVFDLSGLINVLSANPNPPVASAANEVGQVRITWTEPTKYITGLPLDPSELQYRVYRSDAPGGPYTELTTTAKEVTEYIDTAVETWKTYYYAVVAVNVDLGVESDYSNEVPGASIGPPFNFVKACAEQDPDQYYPPDHEGYVNRPDDLDTDGTNVYVADTDNHRISVFLESDCTFVPPPWGGLGFTDGYLKYPTGVVEESGSVFVADYVSRLQEFDTAGNFLYANYTATDALKITSDGGGHLYLTSYSDEVMKFDIGAGAFLKDDAFYATHPTGIVYNPSNGLLYVSDEVHDVVRAIDPSTGEEQATIGSSGSLYGQLSGPQGLAVDTSGNIYVADPGNHRVQVFSTSGELVNVVGGFGYSGGFLRNPRGVAISPATGNLWVADTRNQRIVEFSPP